MTLMHLEENRRFWDKIYLREMEDKIPNSSEEKIKANKRLEAFLSKYKDLFDLHRPSSTG